MLRPEDVELIVTHTSATPEGVDIRARDIDRWHRKKGWLSIGYHKVICLDGTVELGRPLDVPGAHALGYNHKSIGVCLIGGVSADDPTQAVNTYTYPQMEALAFVIADLLCRFPNAKVVGHNELNPKKACPCFDVQAWLPTIMLANP